MVVNRSTAETGEGDRCVIRIVEEIFLGREDVVERESRIVYLPITRERWSRMTRPDGGRLPVEFYKSATTFTRDTFGCKMKRLLSCSGGLRM